ncbi:MAG: hypothetical protein ACMZ7B_13505 [Balneola sp.]
MESYSLNWVKDVFSHSYSFFVNGTVVGELKDSSLSGSKKAFLFGTKYVFEPEGVFKKQINIINLSTKAIVGRISFNQFRWRATIYIGENSYLWKWDGYFLRKWGIYKNQKERILSVDKRKEGLILVKEEETPLLLLCGLLIRTRYYRMGYG